MIAVITACILSFVMFQGSAAGKHSRIINGFNLKISEAPYQVAIFEVGQLICGGSIISSRHILSAAHCFDRVVADMITVRSGSKYAQTGGSTNKVSKIISHPMFGIPVYLDNDISVLVLAEELQFDANTEAAILSGSEAFPDDEVEASGWGRLSFDGGLSPVLKGAKLRIITREVCQMFYEEPINSDKICANDHQQILCIGDSGGPLVNNIRHQIGIASTLKEGCLPPELFTNVPAYRSFIDEATDNSASWS